MGRGRPRDARLYPAGDGVDDPSQGLDAVLRLAEV